MSEEVQNSLIESRIKTIANLGITWYGREPLLAFSDRIIKLCDDNNVNYSASVITNGYLLNSGIDAN